MPLFNIFNQINTFIAQVISLNEDTASFWLHIPGVDTVFATPPPVFMY